MSYSLRVRFAILATLSALLGCTYPEFGFAGDAVVADVGVEDSTIDTGAPLDTSVVDEVSSDSIFPTDDVADTTSTDTFKPDTAMPPDTSDKVGCMGSTSVFCVDFDGSGATPLTGWDDSYLRGSGALTLDTTLFRSPTRSLLTTMPIGTGEVSANVHKVFVASAETRPMALEFSVRFDKVPTIAGPLVAKLGRGSGGRGVALYLGVNTFGIDAMGPTGTTNYRMPGTVPANTWIRVRIEAMLSPTSGWLKLVVNGKTETYQSGIPTAGAAGTDVKVNLGLYESDPPTAIKAYFDDVTFDWL